MVEYYQHLVQREVLQLDQEILKELKDAAQQELEKLETTIQDAVKNQGETEVRDAHHAKARFYDRVGDKTMALKSFEETLSKTVGIGQKIDLVFEIIRMGFAWKDTAIIKEYISKAKGYDNYDLCIF
jgi:26S proteasome regulatory subunit N7